MIKRQKKPKQNAAKDDKEAKTDVAAKQSVSKTETKLVNKDKRAADGKQDVVKAKDEKQEARQAEEKKEKNSSCGESKKIGNQPEQAAKQKDEKRHPEKRIELAPVKEQGSSEVQREKEEKLNVDKKQEDKDRELEKLACSEQQKPSSPWPCE